MYIGYQTVQFSVPVYFLLLFYLQCCFVSSFASVERFCIFLFAHTIGLSCCFDLITRSPSIIPCVLFHLHIMQLRNRLEIICIFFEIYWNWTVFLQLPFLHCRLATHIIIFLEWTVIFCSLYRSLIVDLFDCYCCCFYNFGQCRAVSCVYASFIKLHPKSPMKRSSHSIRATILTNFHWICFDRYCWCCFFCRWF